MSEDRSPRQVVSDLVEKSPICFLTTVASDGRLVSRPMTRIDKEFDGTLRFVAPRDGDVVAEIHADDRVGVAVQSSDGFVSLSGTSVESADRGELESQWSPAVSAWFPDGPETATILHVDARSAEFWDSTGSSVAHIASFVKAAVTDNEETPDMGERGDVDL